MAIRRATAQDAHLPAFDNTKLVAINTCPTWGLVTYDLHKTLRSSTREMALEAGEACHQVFAGVRLAQLYADGISAKTDPTALVHKHTHRLFGSRWSYIAEALPESLVDRNDLFRFASRILETSGFEDSPFDKRRTYSNLEEALLAYCDRIELTHPVWIRDPNDLKSDVGIEIGFDVVIEFTTETGIRTYRFIGKMDGLHHRSVDNHELLVAENKTGARIDDVWATAIDMSHQVTGYSLAASVFAEASCSRALAIGLQIPLPKRFDAGLVEHVSLRPDHMFAAWLDWFWHTTQIWEEYRHQVTSAPLYTHSCNRYFRTCSLVPLCSEPSETRQSIIDEMETRVWNPLDEGDQPND